MSSSPRSTGALVLGGVGAALLVLGVIFMLVGSADYTDYTGRADAVVVERDVDHRRTSSGSSRSDIDVYVSYQTEDGTRIEHAELGGLNPSDYDEGEQLQVAYHPDHPGDPVTVRSTEDGAFGLFGIIGTAVAVVGVGFAAWGTVLFLRHRRS